MTEQPESPDLTTGEDVVESIPSLTLSMYQLLARETAIYPSPNRENFVQLSFDGLTYVVLGLGGEAGELSNKVKKWLRDGTLDREAAILELGDVLWYVAMTAHELGIDLNHVAIANVDKLMRRQLENTLQGSGDDR